MRAYEHRQTEWEQQNLESIAYNNTNTPKGFGILLKIFLYDIKCTGRYSSREEANRIDCTSLLNILLGEFAPNDFKL